MRSLTTPAERAAFFESVAQILYARYVCDGVVGRATHPPSLKLKRDKIFACQDTTPMRMCWYELGDQRNG